MLHADYFRRWKVVLVKPSGRGGVPLVVVVGQSESDWCPRAPPGAPPFPDRPRPCGSSRRPAGRPCGAAALRRRCGPLPRGGGTLAQVSSRRLASRDRCRKLLYPGRRGSDLSKAHEFVLVPSCCHERLKQLNIVRLALLFARFVVPNPSPSGESGNPGFSQE